MVPSSRYAGRIDRSAEYYLVDLLVDETGLLTCGTFTQWDGFESERPIVERRVPRPIRPEIVSNLWDSLHVPYAVVSNEVELIKFYQIGGAALIEQSITEEYFPFLFKADTARPFGVFGFRSLSVDEISRIAIRAPSKTLRMRVIRRDNWRCRCCGRRPEDHTDIELHVHHIRPWGDGGATVEDNLITLCSTCHDGLEPHYDPGLFNLIGVGIESADGYARRLIEGAIRYREQYGDFRDSGPVK